MLVRSAVDDRDFRAAPFGACVAAERFVYFCARAGLCGVVLWGRPVAEDLRRLDRLLAVALEPGFPRHAVLVDAGRVEGVDADRFDAVGEYLRGQREALARQIERVAVVRPPALAGAAVAGLLPMEDASCAVAVEVVRDARAGLRWLGETDDGLAAALEARIGAAAGLAPVVVELRRMLDARSGRMALEEAARGLRRSPRELMRELDDAGVTFGAEVGAAQVRAAQRLLLDSNLQVTEIAAAVGCATAQQLSAVFRRVVGESPSLWRDRHRR